MFVNEYALFKVHFGISVNASGSSVNTNDIIKVFYGKYVNVLGLYSLYQALVFFLLAWIMFSVDKIVSYFKLYKIKSAKSINAL